MNRLPITLVGGFPGAGKTSLLHHIISEHRGGHLAVLVENPGPLNLDARALRGLCGAMRRTHDTVREIPDLDESGQVAWIKTAWRDLSESGRFERVLVEIAGTTNAARLADHLGQLNEISDVILDGIHPCEIVCVIDALDFYRTLVAPSALQEPDDLLALQRAQIEGASLLVLNKCDLLGQAERDACTKRLLHLNAHASLVEAAYGEVPGAILFRGDGAWTSKQKAEATPSRGEVKETFGSSSPLAATLYRAYRPFHPERFWNWFNAEQPGLLRMKGLVWLASRNLLVGGVSRTRWQNSCGAAGVWWAALPREEWPTEPDVLLPMQDTWREPYGDRRQELVLLSEARISPAMRRQLDACLLTDEEFARPVADWKALPDPFPAWDLEGI